MRKPGVRPPNPGFLRQQAPSPTGAAYGTSSTFEKICRPSGARGFRSHDLGFGSLTPGYPMPRFALDPAAPVEPRSLLAYAREET